MGAPDEKELCRHPVRSQAEDCQRKTRMASPPSAQNSSSSPTGSPPPGPPALSYKSGTLRVSALARISRNSSSRSASGISRRMSRTVNPHVRQRRY